ncbi:MAG: hypothetical protein HYW49_12735 [Deltaproteobacteria bacterium]|nr:hypothetical protein [Deltaproteobacteria bacterium]
MNVRGRYGILLILAGAIGLTPAACSIATTRPIQEMSYADSALRAARDLHADTLSPELFRAATEVYSNAKREYRLKNFDTAKRYAMKSMRLSERAEFDAYLKGGATPEVASKQVPTEGASADPEEAMKKATALRRQMEEENHKLEAERRKAELAEKEEEPELSPEEESAPAETGTAPKTAPKAGSADGAEKAPPAKPTENESEKGAYE